MGGVPQHLFFPFFIELDLFGCAHKISDPYEHSFLEIQFQDGRTDRPTDRQTDRQTHRSTYRGGAHLKINIYIYISLFQYYFVAPYDIHST